jgi:enamine deaminase RidA (YjgF/YER057c/UK114 family)
VRHKATRKEIMHIETIRSSAPRPLAHYNECFKVGPWVFAAGQIASDYQTGVAPDARQPPGCPSDSSDITLQTQYVLGNLAKTFEAAGSSLDQVVQAQVFLTDLTHVQAFDEVWRDYFPVPPARTIVATSGLLVAGGRVAIALIGHVLGTPSQREVITSRHPPPLGNSAEAIRAGDLIIAAGQIASDDQTGVAPEARVNPAFPYYGSPIKQQTRYILKQLQHTFATAGSSLDHVVKAQVFLTDLNDFYAFDEVWKEFFANPPPRTTVGIPGLLVEGCRVEIDLIGVTAAELLRALP